MKRHRGTQPSLRPVLVAASHAEPNIPVSAQRERWRRPTGALLPLRGSARGQARPRRRRTAGPLCRSDGWVRADAGARLPGRAARSQSGGARPPRCTPQAHFRAADQLGIRERRRDGNPSPASHLDRSHLTGCVRRRWSHSDQRVAGTKDMIGTAPERLHRVDDSVTTSRHRRQPQHATTGQTIRIERPHDPYSAQPSQTFGLLVREWSIQAQPLGGEQWPGEASMTIEWHDSRAHLVQRTTVEMLEAPNTAASAASTT